MGITVLFATVATLAAFVLPLVALLKQHLGLKGKVVLLTSLLLGAFLGGAFAAGGLADLRVLPAWPPALGGALLGILAGLVASGGRDFITGLQATGAKLGATHAPPPAVVVAPPAEDCESPEPVEYIEAELPPTMLRLPEPGPAVRPATPNDLARLARGAQ